MNINPSLLAFGRMTIIDVGDPDYAPAANNDDHASEGEDVSAAREPERDDTEQFERSEVRVFERWLRRFGRSLDYWIWSGERR